MQTIFSIWLFIILFFSFYKLKWGVALYLAYTILVPIVQINFVGIQLGQNLINTAFILSYIIYAKRYNVKTDWKPLMPFIFYYIAALVLMPFQNGVPFSIMMNSWRIGVMSTLFLPFVMWNVMNHNVSSVKLFRNTALISVFIAIGYGLLLTTTGGINPYIMLMPIDRDMTDYYEAAGGGRIYGRISSVFIHPMTFALFIGLAFIYLFYIKEKMRKSIFVILFIATSIMALLCGVRSVLGGLAVAIASYFLIGRNYKLLFYFFIIGVVSFCIISEIPELSSYLGSIADVNNKKSDVSGSSLDMRINQLYGAIDIAKQNPLCGLGYGWTGYYQSLKGDHPVCLAFESLIFMIICNQGILGFIIWAILIVKYLKVNKKYVSKDIPVVSSLIVFYICYSCITGEYGYMINFLIFYTLILGENTIEKSENLNRNNKYETKNHRALSSSISSISGE